MSNASKLIASVRRQVVVVDLACARRSVITRPGYRTNASTVTNIRALAVALRRLRRIPCGGILDDMATSTSSSSSFPLTLTITGMSCDHCIRAVSKTLASVPGVVVKHVDVGRAQVEYDGRSESLNAIVHAVDDAGYEARAEAV
jgi:copper chaperone